MKKEITYFVEQFIAGAGWKIWHSTADNNLRSIKSGYNAARKNYPQAELRIVRITKEVMA